MSRWSYGTLPTQSRDEARADAATATALASTIDELTMSARAMEQAQALVDFGAKPLIVVTAGRGHDVRDSTAQHDLARLSTNSLHRVVADATHASLILEERDAAASSQAVRDVVESVRTSRPLTQP